MQPKISQTRASTGLGLRNLIGMMDRDMIFTTAMDIKQVAQIFRRHGRALDMPARETAPPGTIPLHLTLIFWR